MVKKEIKQNNSRKSTFLGIGVMVIVASATYLGAKSMMKPTENKEAKTTTGYSISEVAKHASETDCWVAIDKKVYDATSFIEKHSAGKKNILDYCGKDASVAWNTKNKVVAKMHSEGAKLLLGKQLVGELK